MSNMSTLDTQSEARRISFGAAATDKKARQDGEKSVHTTVVDTGVKHNKLRNSRHWVSPLRRAAGRKSLLLVCILFMICFAVLAVGHEETSAATSSMTTSEEGIALITQFEGCSLKAYDDLQPNKTLTSSTTIVGTLTIGYGHIGSIDGVKIKWNTTITQAKAEELLAEDLKVYEKSVNNFANTYGLTFTQNEFDALVSFTYNVGENKWSNGSTFRLKTYIVDGIENYTNYEIISAFTAFSYSGGTKLIGLTRRRKAEAAMFLGNDAIAAYGEGTYITESSLNVRKGPGTSYSKVTTVSSGTKIKITETSGYWGKYSGGWVSLDYCVYLYGSLDTPELSSIGVTGSGIKITWEAVDGASKYRVYRKKKGGTYEKIADTASLSYTDKTALDTDTTYYYTVRCVTRDGLYTESSYDSKGLSILYCGVPTLTSISNTSNGIKIQWNAVDGVTNYRIYRKTSSSDSWEKLANTTSTSYTDTDVKKGKTYYYTVRCMDSTGKTALSAYDTTGVSIYRIMAPELSSISNVSSGIKVTWEEVSKATKYRVYRRASGSDSWEKLGDTTTTSYTDKTAKAGNTYYYTVRAISSDGSLSARDSTGISLLCLAAPEATKISNTSSGIKLTWDAAKKASEYYVYRRTSTSGTWTKIGTTTSTSYTDKDVTLGKTYYYSIKTVAGSGKLSARSASVDLMRLEAPEITKVSNVSSGIKLTWNAAKKASKYYVYRRTSESDSWTKIGTTNSTEYTDKNVTAGKTYYYTVKTVNSAGKTSGNAASVELVRLAAPEITNISNVSSGIKVTWNAAKKASEYYVYRRTSTEDSWEKIGTTTSTSYTDKNVTVGKTYYYTVKTVNSKGKTSTTAKSVSLMRLAAPTITKISNTSSGIKLTWDAAKKASKYYIYYRTSTSDGWTKIATTTSTEYTDENVTTGKTYYYTVKAVSSSGAMSATATSVDMMRLAAPEITKISNTASGVKLTWNAAKKASEYYVYRRSSTSDSWTKIAATTSTSYTDKNVTAGETYYYTVKTVNSKGKTSANAKSVKIVRLTTPTLKSVSSTSSGVKISWSKVTNATSYRVYRKSSDSDGWTKLADTTSASYTDKTAVSGKTYYYTVRAYSDDGSSSAIDNTGLKIKYSKPKS